ncbi:MAG: aminoacyl-tRNA hydrolase [Deltaproteobacteria bacterium]|nr:aminoacyl-tRNA hydrolase [Deltaproteobacteria bacterium]
MALIVGLGNPGPKYAGNRHNVGFMVTHHLAERWRAPAWREKFSGLFTKTTLGGEDVVLLEPMTYMNLSGESVQKAMRFFKVSLDQVVVVHDELDHPFGEMKIKVGGGTAGHNGLKSIVQHCGGNGFTRIRFGIGRPRHGAVDKYVLSDFSSEESIETDTLIERAADMAEAVVRDGTEKAMRKFHRR